MPGTGAERLLLFFFFILWVSFCSFDVYFVNLASSFATDRLLCARSIHKSPLLPPPASARKLLSHLKASYCFFLFFFLTKPKETAWRAEAHHSFFCGGDSPSRTCCTSSSRSSSSSSGSSSNTQAETTTGRSFAASGVPKVVSHAVYAGVARCTDTCVFADDLCFFVLMSVHWAFAYFLFLS